MGWEVKEYLPCEIEVQHALRTTEDLDERRPGRKGCSHDYNSFCLFVSIVLF